MPFYNKCCVPNCADMSTNTRHIFPNPKKDMDRFKKWLYAVNNHELNNMDPPSVFTSNRICHIHFEDRFVSTRSQRLHSNAVPTLFLQSIVLLDHDYFGVTNEVNIVDEELNNTQYMTAICEGMNLSSKRKSWNPCLNLLAEVKENNYSVVILNTPINFSFNPRFVVDLWCQAKVKLTVDGGTERWLTWLTMNQSEFKTLPHPDLITGDMDSISKDIIEYFQEIDSTKIIVTPDQDETDYFKALKELQSHCFAEKIELDTIYVLADTCGRLDQIMNNLNTLHKSKKILGDVNIFQVASSSLSWLLDIGGHVIDIPQQLIDNQDWCALIPIGAPSTVTTTGLKWNLDNQKLEFGGLVSSSNTYNGSSQVTIDTSSPLIWSMSIDSLL